MLDQLRTHRIREPDADTFGLKLAPGGLMEAEYLIAFLCLKHAAVTAELATVDYAGLAPLIETKSSQFVGLSAALDHLRQAHFYERLLGWEGKTAAQINRSEHSAGLSASDLLQQTADARELIRSIIDQKIIGASHLSGKSLKRWEDKKVGWAD